MIENKRFKTFTLGLSLLIAGASFGQTTGKAFINGSETSVINFDAEEYKVEFPINEESIKGAYMTKLKNFQFAIEIFLENAGSCNTEAITNWQDSYSESSISNLAKNNTPLVYTIKKDELNSALKRELDDCGWTKGANVALKLLIGFKSGKMMPISKITLAIPSDSQSKSLEKSSKIVYDLFTKGQATRDIKNVELEKGVQSYMYNKWERNVTTVHITSLKYTNTAGTNYDVEGYYITQSNDGCMYNAFFGNGVKHSNKYSINYFNSGTADKPLNCSTADKLKNL